MCSRCVWMLAIVVLLAACGSEDKASSPSSGHGDKSLAIQDVDLSGTWAYTLAEDVINASTGEYLHTNYYKYTYVLSDASDGVKSERCWEAGYLSIYGIKTADRFYMSVNDEGFRLVNANELVQQSEYSRDQDPGFVFRAQEQLVRISRDALIDNGALSLSGANVNLSETEHVCYYFAHRSVGNFKTLEIVVPYQDDRLMLNMSYAGDLAVGHYRYRQHDDENQILYFDIISNADDFWGSVGSNILAPTAADIEITKAEPQWLEGSFSFVGRDAESYTGVFSLRLP